MATSTRDSSRYDPSDVTDDEQPFDLSRIAEVFLRHGVRYVAIGGVSGLLHGAVEYLTVDVDVLVRSDQENLDRVVAALTELGASSAGELTAADLDGNTQWNRPAGPIDVLLTATGPNDTFLVYADVQPASELFEVGNGQLVSTASLDDVIRMKEATGRQKDHIALPELRRLRGDPHPERSRDDDPFEGFELDEDHDD